jgi:hypothetical protein
MTAREVKDALRSRHPALRMRGPGEWTVIEEWERIDMLAWSAWSGFKRIGYEVKVSRSDYRSELLKPDKRVHAMALVHEFYFAVPKGLLTDDEIAYEETLWDDGDFKRVKCPAKCTKVGKKHEHDRYLPRRGTLERARVPVPVVSRRPRYYDGDLDWVRASAEREGLTTDEYVAREVDRCVGDELKRHGWTQRLCRTCGGKGYIKGSRVEREAPTLWVPNDVGLVEVDGRGCTVRRAASSQSPRDLTNRELADLVRWCSYRGDPRHRSAAA